MLHLFTAVHWLIPSLASDDNPSIDKMAGLKCILMMVNEASKILRDFPDTQNLARNAYLV